jgi:hypothetical protein
MVGQLTLQLGKLFALVMIIKLPLLSRTLKGNSPGGVTETPLPKVTHVKALTPGHNGGRQNPNGHALQSKVVSCSCQV